MLNFPELIQKKRNLLGISQQKCADLCCVTRATFSQWERGLSLPSRLREMQVIAVLDKAVADHFLLQYDISRGWYMRASVVTDPRQCAERRKRYLKTHALEEAISRRNLIMAEWERAGEQVVQPKICPKTKRRNLSS